MHLMISSCMKQNKKTLIVKNETHENEIIVDMVNEKELYDLGELSLDEII